LIRFALTIFLGAFLVFQVQPIVAKALLPWFGGTPGVWTTCMLFFQVLLLAGYGWAHGLVSRLGPRAQVLAHLGLVSLALGLLAVQALIGSAPILPPESLRPMGAEAPAVRILWLLALATGLPYLVLAANSPLMQAWFHASAPGRSPYRLFVLSNLGSMLALLSYPFLVEPFLELPVQGLTWAGLFALFATGAFACGLRAWRASPRVPGPAEPGHEPPPSRPGPARHLAWAAMAACASAMLVASTNQICQEVAVIPFLWILPLSLYLLSFILTFDSSRWYSRRIFGPALVVLALGTLALLFEGPAAGMAAQIGGFSLALFCVCMICHGELVRLKPHPRHLTGFYLMVSLGGAAGGLFVGLLAPLLFVGFWELHLALFGAATCLWLLGLREPHGFFQRGPRPRLRRALATSAVVLFGALLLVNVLWLQRKAVWTSRSFYGLLWVEQVQPEDPLRARRDLVHGQIRHGSQFMSPAARGIPTAYYGRESGAGLALVHHPRRADPLWGGSLRVGVVGLGVGTLAAFGQPGDVFRFYEIHPGVIELARGKEGFFSYLEDTPAQVDIVLGDARLQLEAELRRGEPQQYDVLVVDAFSSDSIPVHLLTVEAFEIYLRHLDPDGVLALHVSNRHLNLVLVVARLAQHFLLPAALVATPGDGLYSLNADWVLVTRNEYLLALPELQKELSLPDPARTTFPVGLWTDAFSNLAEILE
jgi:hypothetical protein